MCWGFSGDVKLTSSDIVTGSAEFLQAFEVGIGDIELVKFDRETEDLLWNVGSQRLRIWSINDFSGHFWGVVVMRIGKVRRIVVFVGYDVNDKLSETATGCSPQRVV